jgi:hypothetical protein
MLLLFDLVQHFPENVILSCKSLTTFTVSFEIKQSNQKGYTFLKIHRLMRKFRTKTFTELFNVKFFQNLIKHIWLITHLNSF